MEESGRGEGEQDVSELSEEQQDEEEEDIEGGSRGGWFWTPSEGSEDEGEETVFSGCGEAAGTWQEGSPGPSPPSCSSSPSPGGTPSSGFLAAASSCTAGL